MVSHEIAHQWFGDAVTEDEWDDVWLSEGFATYFANLFTEHFAGREALVDALKRGRVGAFRAERQQQRAIVHQNEKGTGPDLTQVQYAKGGWVLHVLRGQVGTDNFWKGIQLYYARHRDGSATSDDLRRDMEEASGQDLGWFFAQWLTRADSPITGRRGGCCDPRRTGSWWISRRPQRGRPTGCGIEVGITPTPGATMQDRDDRDEPGEAAIRDRRRRAAERGAILDPNVWMLMDARFVARGGGSR